MAQLVRANKALYDVTTAYGVPPISGKDSMKNDSVRGERKISIPPTVLFSAVGKMDDVRQAVTMYFKRPGDLIYVIGLTRDELGASEYYRLLAREQGNPGHFGGRVPSVDTLTAMGIYRAMNEASGSGLLRSSHTPTLGGLAVGLALAALGGELGTEIDLGQVPAEAGADLDALLFSESHSRFIISCSPDKAEVIEEIFTSLPCGRVGRVTAEPRLRISDGKGETAIDARLAALRSAFKDTLYGI